MEYYNDRRIWITGASSGIGLALTEELAKSGAKLVITARRESLLNEIKESSPRPENIHVLPGDLSEIDKLNDISTRAWDAFGGLDMAIMNAGVSQRSLFREMEFETGRKLFDINFFAHAGIMHELLPRFEKQGSGHIAAVTSLSALIPSPLRIYYSSAKHALHGFYETLRTESWNSGVRVSLIIPGFIKTDISYKAVTGDGKAFGALDPLQKAGSSPAEAALKILKQLKKQKREIYVGYTPNAAIARFLGKFFPALLSKILRNMTSV
ncbi:MAG TPA: short-chain dehydrogenase [Spirochaeta sp.]|nr:short-chain dehydrogenase [Spirochaeta sp.]